MLKKIININSEDILLLKLFWQHIYPYRRWLILSVTVIPISIMAALLIPWLTSRVIDHHLIAGNKNGFEILISIFAASVFIGYLADGIYTFSLQKSGQLAIASIRNKLFLHTMNLPRSYFDKTPIGVFLSRLTSDMEAVGESLAIGVLNLFTDMIKTVFLIIFLLYLNWQLTVIIITILPIIYIVISVLRKKLRYYFNLTRESLAKATAFLHECLNGIKTIQLFAAENKVLSQFKSKNSAFFKAQCKSNIFDASLYSIIDGLTTIAMVVIIWRGAYLAKSDLISIGVLIAFINVLSKIFIPIREFAQQISLIQRALSALQHVNGLFKEPAEELNELDSPNYPLAEFSELVFDNVSFRYSKQGEYVLKDVCFKLRKGQRLALVGATGSGKSTIFKLLTKTYTNYEGTILINGTDLKVLPKNNLLAMISLMQQDVFLFEESLKFNIGLQRTGLSEKEIETAARYVFAHEFIKELPNQYDFQITENGGNLSAGQGQLISFARAIAANSSLMLLDEATSSIDSVTENLIQKAIENIFKQKTVMAIAHRLSTIKNVDLIIVMYKGTIIEQGTHTELVANQSHYSKMLSSFSN